MAAASGHVFGAYAVELHLVTSGHVFEAFVFRVIGMNRIRSNMHRLKIVLLQGSTPVILLPSCYLILLSS